MLMVSAPMSFAKSMPYRVGGENRFEVATNIASQEFQDAHRVILVNHTAWADALSSNNLSRGEAPILYVQQNQLTALTQSWLEDHEVDEVMIVGGPRSVSESVEAQIKALLPDAQIKRFGGSDRYDVSLQTALENKAPNTVLVDGTTYADALAAAPLITAKNANIVLLLPEAIQKESIAHLAETDGLIWVIGSTLPAEKIQQVLKADGIDRELNVIGGADRYEVSVQVQKRIFPDPKGVIVASGEGFSDALVGGPIAQKRNLPILLVRKTSASESVKQTIFADSVHETMVLGGRKTIDFSEDLFPAFNE